MGSRGQSRQKAINRVLARRQKHLKMSLQLFGEKDLQKQPTSSLKRSIRTLKKRIREHIGYIENPKSHCFDWDTKDEREKAGLIKHWDKEIKNFQESIENRIAELKKRGEWDGE